MMSVHWSSLLGPTSLMAKNSTAFSDLIFIPDKNDRDITEEFADEEIITVNVMSLFVNNHFFRGRVSRI